MKVRFPALLTLASLGAIRAAFADPQEGRWSTTILAGAEFVPRSEFQGPDNGQLIDLGALDPALLGSTGTTSVDRLSYRDAFRTGGALGFETSYDSSANLESYFRLGFDELRGRGLQLGDISSSAFSSPAPLDANFNDLKSVDFTLGERYYFLDSGSFRPFVSGFVGADHTDALRARFTSTPLQFDSGSALLLPSATRFDAGLEGGASYGCTDRTALQFKLGLDYVTARHADSAALAPLGLSELSLREPRWSVPAEVGVTYRF